MAAVELSIPINLEAVARFCREHGLRRLRVFGSVLRDDFDPARSDVDVIAEYLPGRAPGWELIEHQDELSRIIGRPVDYCTRLNRHVAEAIGAEFLTLYQRHDPLVTLKQMRD